MNTCLFELPYLYFTFLICCHFIIGEARIEEQDTGIQLSLSNLLNVNTGLDRTQLSSVDIDPYGSIRALDTGKDTGTQLSLGNLLNVNTGLDETQLPSVDIGPDGSSLAVEAYLVSEKVPKF